MIARRAARFQTPAWLHPPRRFAAAIDRLRHDPLDEARAIKLREPRDSRSPAFASRSLRRTDLRSAIPRRAAMIGRMANRAFFAAFRLVFVLAMTAGLALSPVGASSSHDPMALLASEAARHAELSAQIAEHGHAHDGAAEERSSGHSHGHDPADHSHQTLNAAPSAVSIVRLPGRDWQPCPDSFAHRETRFRLDRPPRATSSI